ncbi:large subunit ribosomal protein L18 [Salinibacillus kushneri]|uniref:Large ribosomal subunit protein uL18 n=1 Tax=Salinibacillus kushneri TaxID=237682 RepID=A0A1I0IXB7_9BACI|nr:50S ribosomal protein L18 [Salinibacillus kushneri]SEU01211.1 large subunit ribosomal protein L18 [Salinibacillus kushneri]
MIAKQDKNAVRKKRHTRMRRNLFGTESRPRLNVYRSNKHIYAQLIDDINGVTVASASTVDKEFDLDTTGNVEAAKKVGEIVAKRALDKGFKSVVFDRGGYLYHGRVKALADSAREAGLEF